MILLTAGAVNTQAQVIVKTRPLAPKMIIVKPKRPGAGHIWVDGHWKWNDRKNKYVWVQGKWYKPRRGYVYVAGRWKRTRKGHVWVEGYWRKRMV